MREGVMLSSYRFPHVAVYYFLLVYLPVLFIAHLLSKTDISNTCFKMAKTDLKILHYKSKIV